MDENFLETAEKLSQLAVDIAVGRVRSSNQERPKNFDGCCECGDDVPAERISLGYYRCITCQSATERMRDRRR